MPNNNAAYTISLHDAISRAVGNIDRRFDRLDRTINRTGRDVDNFGSRGARSLGRMQRGTRDMGGASDVLSNKVMNVGKSLGLAFGAGAAIGGIARLSRNIFQLAADFEQSEIAFGTFLGSAKKGKQLLAELSEFANVTPFTNVQTDKAAKSLLAMGIQSEDLLSTMKTLGDVAAGVGLEKMPQLTLAYGQVKAATRLTGMELRQFTEAGVPLLDELSKVTGKSASFIKEEMISKGKISFDLVKQALEQATGEGGRFFNLMKKQSKSASGLISTFQGKMQLVGREMGKRWLPSVKKSTKGMIGLADKMLDIVKIPLSDKLKKQREELALLKLQLNDTSISEEDRIKILDKLKAINPDIVDGIDAQNIEYGKLNTQIDNVNANLLKQIQLSTFNEKKQKLLNKQVAIKEELSELDVKLGERILTQHKKISKSYGGVVSEVNRLNKELKKYREIALTEKPRKGGTLGGMKTAAERVEVLEKKLKKISPEFNNAKTFLEEYNKVINKTADKDLLSRAGELSNLFRKFDISEAGYTKGIKGAFLAEMQSIKTLRAELRGVDKDVKASVIDMKELEKLLGLGLGKDGKKIQVVKPDKELKEGIQTIKGAAPKTFNINISKMVGVESIETSTTIEEKAQDIGAAIVRVMSIALADTQAIS